MLKEERHNIILREINLHNKVLSNDLKDLLIVSEDTIRRDLNELAEKDLIIKVHGGAMSRTFQPSFDNGGQVYALDAKRVIADKIMRFFRNGMLILMEGGTTNMEIARRIPSDLQATFVTVCPQVALALAEHEQLEVIVLGGRLSKNSIIHTGAGVVNELSNIRPDLCLVGANGVSLQHGLTDSDWEVVQVMKAMIRSGKKTALVTIAEKFGTVKKIKIADLTEIDFVFTELPPDSPALAAYKGNDKPVFF